MCSSCSSSWVACEISDLTSQAEPRQSEGKAADIDLNQRRKEEEQQPKSLELHLDVKWLGNGL